MTRVAQRMRQRQLSGAFLGWRAKVDELLDTRAKLTGIAARFANQKLNAAFNKWSEYAANAASVAKIRSAMARLLNGAAIRCLPAWKEFALEQARLEEVCRKVARRVVMIAAAAAFARWRNSRRSASTTARFAPRWRAACSTAPRLGRSTRGAISPPSWCASARRKSASCSSRSAASRGSGGARGARRSRSAPRSGTRLAS